MITAGETRVENLPFVGENGKVIWGASIFVMSYILVVNWVLLQVAAYNHFFLAFKVVRLHGMKLNPDLPSMPDDVDTDSIHPF
jgi:hypothetical protein